MRSGTFAFSLLYSSGAGEESDLEAAVELRPIVLHWLLSDGLGVPLFILYKYQMGILLKDKESRTLPKFDYSPHLH